MSVIFEQQPITDKEIKKNEVTRGINGRRHRAGYPTPAFYFFAFLLNLGALLLTAWMLKDNLLNLSLVVFAFLSGVGVGMTVFSTSIKPITANFGQRRKLVGVTVAYGFILVAVQVVYGVMNPAFFA